MTANATQDVSSTSITPHDIAIGKIVAETDCSVALAGSTIAWIDGFVRRAREADYATQYPTNREMNAEEYDIFDAIIPHGSPAVVDSAHEAIE